MTSLAHAARRTAGRARNSTFLETLTRAGFVGYGLLHLAVAWLALQIAFGRVGEEGSQSGAFRLLARQPLGRPILIATAVGLAAMAVWQLFEAAIGNREETGTRRAVERLVSAGRTVVYAVLAWTAWQVQSGGATSSASQQRSLTAGLLAHPAGRYLVILAGIAVTAIGLGFVVYGAKWLFIKRLRIRQMSATTRMIAIRLGRLGYIAKGVAFGIAGLLVISAAVKEDAARSNGLDGALHALAGKAYGQVLLLAVALGFAAFGVYCFFQSRYRKV